TPGHRRAARSSFGDPPRAQLRIFPDGSLCLGMQPPPSRVVFAGQFPRPSPWRSDRMLDVAKQAVEAARAAGADYADGRVVADDAESLTVRNQEMEGIDRSSSEGLGIRVLVNGYWGFRATARLGSEEIDRTARLAVEIAKAAARL